jgi:hypothetical protein
MYTLKLNKINLLQDAVNQRKKTLMFLFSAQNDFLAFK